MIRMACNLIWVAVADLNLLFLSPPPSLPLCHSIIETKGRAMEVVTHFVNDTVEFYKWSLTIAGKIFTFTCLYIAEEQCAPSDTRCENMKNECLLPALHKLLGNLWGLWYVLVTSLVLEIGECTAKKGSPQFGHVIFPEVSTAVSLIRSAWYIFITLENYVTRSKVNQEAATGKVQFSPPNR